MGGGILQTAISISPSPVLHSRTILFIFFTISVVPFFTTSLVPTCRYTLAFFLSETISFILSTKCSVLAPGRQANVTSLFRTTASELRKIKLLKRLTLELPATITSFSLHCKGANRLETEHPTAPLSSVLFAGFFGFLHSSSFFTDLPFDIKSSTNCRYGPTSLHLLQTEPLTTEEEK